MCRVAAWVPGAAGWDADGCSLQAEHHHYVQRGQRYRVRQVAEVLRVRGAKLVDVRVLGVVRGRPAARARVLALLERKEAAVVVVTPHREESAGARGRNHARTLGPLIHKVTNKNHGVTLLAIAARTEQRVELVEAAMDVSHDDYTLLWVEQGSVDRRRHVHPPALSHAGVRLRHGTQAAEERGDCAHEAEEVCHSAWSAWLRPN